MNSKTLLPGAIALLAVGMLANAAVIWFGPSQAQVIASGNQVQAQSGQAPQNQIYFLAHDTNFLTQSSDGRNVYLWNYNHSPRPENLRLDFLGAASAR